MVSPLSISHRGISRLSEQRVIVVTGASRGIGRAIAVEMAAAQTHIIINYNSSAEAARQTADLVESKGGSCYSHAVQRGRP